MGRCSKRNQQLINFERLAEFEKCHACSFLEAIVCCFFYETFLYHVFPWNKIVVTMQEK